MVNRDSFDVVSRLFSFTPIPFSSYVRTILFHFRISLFHFRISLFHVRIIREQPRSRHKYELITDKHPSHSHKNDPDNR